MKKIYLVLPLIMTLASCVNEVEDLSREMVFDAIFPEAATKATASSFEKGDRMGVYVSKYDGDKPLPLEISGNYVNNALASFDGAKWRATPPVYWEDGKFDVYAYYPYTKPNSVDNMDFSVALDQSIPEAGGKLGAYEASDFLWAKATGVSQTGSVPLSFSHRMSRLVINLVKDKYYEGDIPSDATVIVHSTIPDAVVDLSAGVVVKNDYSTARSIKAAKVSDSQYVAILVPQRIDTKRPLIEIITKGVSYMVERKFVFRQGTQHTVNVILSDNPDRMRIEIGGEIEGWVN